MQLKNLHGQLEIFLPTTALKATYLFIDHTAFKATYVEAMPPVDIMGLQPMNNFPCHPSLFLQKTPWKATNKTPYSRRELNDALQNVPARSSGALDAGPLPSIARRRVTTNHWWGSWVGVTVAAVGK